MGMFDIVYFDCPKCNSKIGIQSKESEFPQLDTFDLDSAPTAILNNVLNRPHKCKGCGEWIVLYDPEFPPIPRRANPAPLIVTAPAKEHYVSAHEEFWPDNEDFVIPTTNTEKEGA
jgi:hypothetical protein